MVIERGGLTPNTARFTASRDPAALADRGKGGLKYLYTAGTAWADVPADWACPDCGVAKSEFEMVQI